MDTGSIFLILAFVVVIVLFIARPFFQSDQVPVGYATYAAAGDDFRLSSALAERDRILNTLYELDLDHDLGKIPEEDYQPQRVMLLEQGVAALKQIETLQIESGERHAGQAVETPAAARRQQVANGFAAGKVRSANNFHRMPVSSDPNDELEALLAKRRRSRQEPAAGFCPKCSGPLGKSDHFCPRCGVELA